MSYELTGYLTEVCTCDAVCPCFAARDPDGGACAFSWVIDLERGRVGETDVGGLRLGFLGSFEGNPLEAQVRMAVYVDDRASDEQEEALLAAFTGQLGGSLAEVAALIGEVVSVERAPIHSDVVEGTGAFSIGDVAHAEVAALTTPGGTPMRITDMPMSPYFGSPGHPGVPRAHGVDAPEAGYRFRGNSSMQTRIHYVGS